MANQIQTTPSIEIAIQKGGLKNLVRAIAEDSPELLTSALGLAAAAAYGPVEGVAAVFGVKVLHGALKGQGLKQIAAALLPRLAKSKTILRKQI